VSHDHSEITLTWRFDAQDYLMKCHLNNSTDSLERVIEQFLHKYMYF